MSRNPLAAIGLVSAGVLGVGYLVGSYGAEHPIGQQIPEKKDFLRVEGAEAEQVKSGAKPEEVRGKVDLERKGGDKGLKVQGAESNS